MALNSEKYKVGDDGLLVEKVGPWAKDKLGIVARYVQISGATRRKYQQNSPAFIDVFSGPGRSVIRTSGAFIDGSPVTAFKQGEQSAEPFASIEISDVEPELLAAATTRLKRLKAPVHPTEGPASDAIEKIVSSLNPHGLHFALLDPHNLGALSFSIIEQLARLKRVDILVHVSISDLQRNLDLFSSEVQQQLDQFAPGWRNHVRRDMNQQSLRAAIIAYFRPGAGLGVAAGKAYGVDQGGGQPASLLAGASFRPPAGTPVLGEHHLGC
jgi:three-Cys-motif partner protein